jgi:uncharacterized repeat protein (TIGR03806 family)
MCSRVFLVALLVLVHGTASAGDRIPWTASRVHGSPDPPPPYRVELAFPKLRFTAATELINVPRVDYFVVGELTGKVYAFPNRSTIEAADLLVDLHRPVFSVAFHPHFQRNGYMYVVNALERAMVLQVSRFVVERGDHWRCLPDSEIAIFRWPFRGTGTHHGGAMRFGPDGYLYLGVGDSSVAMDADETGQDISDVLASVLRIDVDRPSRPRNYSVPRDNPFVGMPGARPEVWAYGIRQPWKMSFDRQTGELWVGEVGQDHWESVLRVQRGGNYGWSVLEGSHPFRPDRKRGPTPILSPVMEHPHSEFRALIGGFVYRGRRLPELSGMYIYGDHETGKICGIRDGRTRELAATHLRVVAFGEDAAGELYILDHLQGTIHRLEPGAAVPQNLQFPRRLSETGLFASVQDHRPAPGLIPYTVNAPLWSDGASKERFIAMPGNSRIQFEAAPPRPLVNAPPGWAFPDGTVLVKTFSLEMEPGNPTSRRRIETRLLHLQRMADTHDIRDLFWRGYTYRWNDEQTDAELVEATGLDVPLPVRGRQQTWHFPSRAECTMCHTMAANFVLGVTTWQMNRDVDTPTGKVNQLKLLEAMAAFSEPLPAPPEQLARLSNYEDENADVSQRARSYLQANCAHCHILFGGGNSPFQLQANLALPETGVVDVAPVHGSFDLPGARLLAPGKPESSLLWYRLTRTKEGRMPPLASSVVDVTGARLIAAWIRQVPSEDETRGTWLLAGGVIAGAAFLAWLGRRRIRRAR